MHIENLLVLSNVPVVSLLSLNYQLNILIEFFLGWVSNPIDPLETIIGGLT